MTLTLWLSLVAVCILGAVSPGPSLAVVIRHSLCHSTSHGIVVALFHGLGVGIYALLSVLGLSNLVTQSPYIYQGLMYGGAMYLAYMGIKALISSASGLALKDTAATSPVSRWQAARDGFAIAFLNPKLLVFFVALFSQFIDAENRSVSHGAIMVSTVLIIDIIWYCLVAVIIHTMRERLAILDKSAFLDKLVGIVLIGLSIRVFTL